MVAGEVAIAAVVDVEADVDVDVRGQLLCIDPLPILTFVADTSSVANVEFIVKSLDDNEKCLMPFEKICSFQQSGFEFMSSFISLMSTIGTLGDVAVVVVVIVIDDKDNCFGCPTVVAIKFSN